jgi:adenylylsulfate kinase
MATVIWITGLPGSGKSTITSLLHERLPRWEVLNMDAFRKVVTPAPTYSESERECVYRALVYTAKTLFDRGISVIIDATGNRQSWRRLARQLIPRFMEVYLQCPQEICRNREVLREDSHGAPRRIYEKGSKGWPVPGVNVPYEAPEQPEIVIDADACTPDEAAARIIKCIDENSAEEGAP